jgi:Polyketide cyclase / dehydrase and lipid transport
MRLGPSGIDPTYREDVAAPIMTHRRTYDFTITPDRVWAALESFDQYERWWPWLGEFSVEGGALTTGSILYGVVSPPVPFRMRLTIELLRCVPSRSVDAHVHGDLVGEARMRMWPVGNGSQVEVGWDLEMMQRPMRIANRFGHPLLQWGHDQVVQMTVSGFRRHVEAAR